MRQMNSSARSIILRHDADFSLSSSLLATQGDRRWRKDTATVMGAAFMKLVISLFKSSLFGKNNAQMQAGFLSQIASATRQGPLVSNTYLMGGNTSQVFWCRSQEKPLVDYSLFCSFLSLERQDMSKQGERRSIKDPSLYQV
mmetsp:Transcript_33686/g.86352  ORF Transcript_33686/g.86352 Transcript_33686/m.86352 type:complete len:142 (-) Transcript_33686:23-448(-)